MSGRTIGRGVVIAVAALSLLGLVACGEDQEPGDDTTSSSTTTEATSTTADDPGTTLPAEDSVQVGAFFVRGEKVAVGRADADRDEPARGALDALLEGPGGDEAAPDMTSAIPDGTELLDLAVADGVARVDLSEEFTSGGGSLSMQLRAAQVVFTLTQFDTIERVTFLIDGAEVDGLGGEGIPATEVDRSEFENVTPLILVTSPLPGESVDAPALQVDGISNTFEATVLYEVLGPDGEVLDEGFTTATAGTGTWGEFAFEADWPSQAEEGDTGPGGGEDMDLTLVVYQENMEDGGRQDVYEVPLRQAS